MSESLRSPHLLGRQPVIGREQQLLAYALALQDGWIAPAGIDADLLSSVPVSAAPLPGPTSSAHDQLLTSFRTFITVDRSFLLDSLVESLSPHLVTLEIGEEIPVSEEVIARCQALRERGFSFIVSDSVENEGDRASLLELAETIAIDIAVTDTDLLAQQVSRLRRQYDKSLLAQNIESAEQFTLCQEAGFDFYQGYFFAHPTISLSRKLNPSQISLMQLLTLVMEDADTPEIEQAFKQDPRLTLNLLRLTNSAGSGLAVRVTSLRHAITILGRRQLQRWLQLLIYSGRENRSAPTADPLLQLAATRGRLMELLAERTQPAQREFADQAFMTGILSLMPALLGLAMPDILAQLPVAPRIALALTEHSGQLGKLLALVEATEQTDPEILAEALRHVPNLTPLLLETRLEQAMNWAGSLGQEKEADA